MSSRPVPPNRRSQRDNGSAWLPRFPAQTPAGVSPGTARALGCGSLATRGHPDTGLSCLLQEAVFAQKRVLPGCLSQLPRLRPPAPPPACVTHKDRERMMGATGVGPRAEPASPLGVPSAAQGRPALGCLLLSPRRGAVQGILTLRSSSACGQGGRRPRAAFWGTLEQRLPTVAQEAPGGWGPGHRLHPYSADVRPGGPLGPVPPARTPPAGTLALRGSVTGLADDRPAGSRWDSFL